MLKPLCRVTRAREIRIAELDALASEFYWWMLPTYGKLAIAAQIKSHFKLASLVVIDAQGNRLNIL